MRVLIFSQHFTPEITAARSRMQPIAELLVARGHEVEVLTAVPNHPEGIVREGYRGKLSIRRELDGVTVRYLWVRASPHKSFMNRLLLYGSYAGAASLAGIASRRPDVIFATSPPLPAAAAARAASLRHRVPWVMDVRDLWPEAAVFLGELSNPTVIRLAERLERRLYASAAAIVTVTDAFRGDIAAKTEDDAKISVIRNGTTRLWLDIGETEVDRGSLELPTDRFVWTYAGNVGIAQGLEAAIDAAARLGDAFTLLVIGGGPMLEQIKARAESVAPGRVLFRDLVEPEVAARYLRASDATLVPLAAMPELAKFVPSKLFDCCAVSRPVILAAAGESRQLVESAQAALAVAPGDPDELAGAVRRIADDPGLRDRLGERGRAFASEYLRERQMDRLEEVLERAAGS